MSSISQPDPGASTDVAAQTPVVGVFERATSGQDYWFVAVLFAASGFSSLIYQVVWTRLLVLVFGSTTIATSTVLAVFMGGLALGSFLAGRVVDRVHRPLFWYGVLEGLIGIWALATPLLFDSAIPLYRFIWQNSHPDFFFASLVRFFVAAAILLIPTTCMGATLPLLSKHLTTSVKFAAAQVGTLYAINTVGAVGGVLWAGFILLPGMGMSETTMFAAVINLALLALVLAHAKRLEVRREAERQAEPPQVLETIPVSAVLIVLSFAASGALSMIYEVGWTRALLMVIGSSTYAFTVMLATFLIGIFSGSLICAKIVNQAKEPLSWFGILQLAVCVCALIALFQFNLLPWWNLQINAIVPDNPDAAMFGRFVLAGSILLPLSCCLGATFPLAVRACATELAKIGGTVAALYSANTLGAIVGAFAAGFVFVPLFGVEKTLLLTAAANYMLGVALLAPTKTIRRPIKIVSVAICLALIGWLVVRPAAWDKSVIAFAQPERRKLDEKLRFSSHAEFVKLLRDSGRVLFWKDGASSNVAVWESADKSKHSFITNGHVDGSDGGDMPVQCLLGGFPMVFRPDAADVAVIGWGTGVTVGTVARFPVKSITAIELEPAVVQASPFFHHVNYAPELDPRVDIQFNDARNYLLATDKQFDVVISEPSNPWQAGVCNLFTSEFFKICHNTLKKDGIFALWLQTSEVSPFNVRSIFASLRSQFRYQLAMHPCPANLVILASDTPLTLDVDKVRALFANRRVATTLARVGVKSPEAVVSRLQADTAGIAKLVDDAPANVDDTNHLEYSVGRTYETYSFADKNQQMMDTIAIAPPFRVAVPDTLSPESQAQTLARVAQDLLNSGKPKEALRWVDLSLAVKQNTDALRVAGYAHLKMGNLAEAYNWWGRALALDPTDQTTLQLRCAAYLEFGQTELARQDCQRMLSIDPNDAFARYALAERSVVLKEPGQVAIKLLGSLPDDRTFVAGHHDVLHVAAAAYYRLGDQKKAQTLLEEYMTLEPTSVMGARLLGTVLFNQGDTSPAAGWWARSLYSGMIQSGPLFRKASQLAKSGDDTAAAQILTEAVDLYPDAGARYPELMALSKRNQQVGRLLSKINAILPEK